jgi:glucose/arabinose dehydrogenase
MHPSTGPALPLARLRDVLSGAQEWPLWPAVWRAANIPPPLQAVGPHVTPLGITFYPSFPEGLPAQEGGPWPLQLWPEEYWGRLFVAERGSWNREPPIGYRLAVVEVRAWQWAAVPLQLA